MPVRACPQPWRTAVVQGDAAALELAAAEMAQAAANLVSLEREIIEVAEAEVQPPVAPPPRLRSPACARAQLPGIAAPFRYAAAEASAARAVPPGCFQQYRTG